jgi:Leucine-rich repeat (LRR) protein
MKKIITSIAVSAVVVLTGCGDSNDPLDYNTSAYPDDYNSTTADAQNDVYGVLDGQNTNTTPTTGAQTVPANSEGEYGGTSSDTNRYTNNPDLGELITDDGTTADSTDTTNYTNDMGEYYDLESFKAWYQSECKGVFKSNLYIAKENRYNGTIDCKNKGLESVDLNYVAVFDSVYKIDLSHNKLTTIDLTPLGEMTKIGILDLSHNQLEMTLEDFKPLSNLKSIDELWINNNKFKFTRKERDELYRMIPNTKNDTVKFKTLFK